MRKCSLKRSMKNLENVQKAINEAAESLIYTFKLKFAQ